MPRTNIKSIMKNATCSLFLLSLPMYGCTAEIGDLAEDDDATSYMSPDDEGDIIATSEEELQSVGVFSWNQGSNALGTGSTSDRVCFLTRMRGLFEGHGEMIRTFISGSSWYLGGQSQQKDVAASSYCALTTAGSYTGEYSWHQNNSYPTIMRPTINTDGTKNVCFLTRITGRFMGWGEWLRIYESGGYWYLHGGSQQKDVAASARCVKLPTGASYSGEYTWHQGQIPTYMGSTTNRACALTSVAGKFRGWGEMVEIIPSGGSWYLQGTSQQQDVQAQSRCF
jgi:hypothetical protein